MLKRLVRIGTVFLLTPLREGRPASRPKLAARPYFYSRPCGRGDVKPVAKALRLVLLFLLTPLREGRPSSAPPPTSGTPFLLTPLREGRLASSLKERSASLYFYSRPCGRGDSASGGVPSCINAYFYSRPCGRGDVFQHYFLPQKKIISTHAPAGGATRRS